MKKYTLKKISTVKKDYKIKYEEELNERQLEAVQNLEGPLLVIAGAGSGKTRTLIYRVARLVEEGIKPENILLLTFTRKASQEMLRRASLLLDKRCGKIAGGTFHSFGNIILRKYAKLLGFSNNFTILDRSDAEDVLNLLRTRLGYNKMKTRFPRKQTILKVISKALNKSTSIGDILSEEYPHFMDNLPEIEYMAKEYKIYKKEHSLMDYDDLLVYLKILLEQNEGVKEKLSEYYKYIMIDEYQDTNRLQAETGRLLAFRHNNIMAVGDDSQSIYSFRGANFRNIMDFPKIFPGAKIITIEENYRSTQPVLDLTNNIIKHAKEKYSKTLFTKNKGTGKPVFITAQSENYQSAFIVQRVLELREEGIPLNQIAVLFRSGWHSNELEIELAAGNIPFVKYGGFKFIETAHVKDIIGHLRVSLNPMDSVSWLRILLLLDGIGTKTAHSIVTEIVENKQGTDFLKEKKLRKKKFSSALEKLYDIIQRLAEEEIPPAEKTEELLKYYNPLLKKKYDDFNKRQNDLESFTKIMERYKSMEQFLVDITLEPPELSQIEEEETSKDREEKLILSTIHSAKGLEWHTVFIIFVNDGYIPSSYSLESQEALEEERRLLYVATTRAKENLYLIKPSVEYRGGYFSNVPVNFSKVSRFLEEGDILEKYVDKWMLIEEKS